jgi:hypothetical protein
MCKHVAAVMYGIGARLDHDPAMLFTLRRVSLDELLASAVTELPATPANGRVLAAGGLASLFGIELVDGSAPAPPAPPARSPGRGTKATPTRRTGTKATPRSKPRAASADRRAPAAARAVPTRRRSKR